MGQFHWVGKNEDGSQVILHKFTGQFKVAPYASPAWIQSNKELVRTGIVLDTETTGRSKTNDSIIEIGVQEFFFNKSTGEVVGMGETFSALQEPPAPLTEEIKIITGLTDYDLRGKSIDWTKVDAIFERSDIIIAHNAAFDRPFVDKKSRISPRKPWACTVRQIDWMKRGFPSSKLELLSVYHGFFTDAHRALNDVNALLNVLTMQDYLNELLTTARKPLVKVVATGAPFESKDLLKERGYGWDANARVWAKTLFKDDLETERAWLDSLVYKGSFKGQIIDIPVTDNFK